MKFRNLFSAIIIFLLVISCKKEDSDITKPEDIPDQVGPFVSTTIGSSGGKIEITNVSISVSAGSLPTPIKFDLQQYSQSLEIANSVTPLYKIESTATTAPLSKIKIKYNGTLSGQSYIQWSENCYVTSKGKIAANYLLIPAKDSAGFLIANLSSIDYSRMNKSTASTEQTVTGYFYGKTGVTTLTSSGGHFKLHFSASSLSYAQTLAGYLETAYTTLASYGFNFIGRDWPALVYLESFSGWYNNMFFDKDAYGYYVTTTRNPAYLAFRTNNCAMYFNLDLMNQSTEMKATAAHEFFHAVQDLYDLRDMASKKYIAAPQAWLDEATATWFEGSIMSSPSSYVPSILQGKELVFKEGIHVNSNVQDHGYGMSTMIKYITNQKGNSSLSNIYSQISGGSHPVNAIFSAMNSSGFSISWWEEYLKQLVLGNIYNISSTTFGNVDASFRYESKTLADTLNTFTNVSYPDLSAKLYQVYLNNPDIATKKTTVTFTPTNGTSKVMLFKFASSNTFIKTGTSTTQLSDAEIRGLLSGTQLKILALVTNGDYSSQFLGKKDIGLKVRINYGAAPTISLQPNYWEGKVDESKSFSLTVTNPPAKLKYEWNWGDGKIENPTSTNVWHSYNKAGVYSITVNLYDMELNQIVATTKGTAKVVNNPPRISPDATEGLINTGYQWNIIMDYTLANARYEWNFGDNTAVVTRINDQTATHTYTKTGEYIITATIYDNSQNLKLDVATGKIKIIENTSGNLNGLDKTTKVQVIIEGDTKIGTQTNIGSLEVANTDGFSTVGNVAYTECKLTWTGNNFRVNGVHVRSTYQRDSVYISGTVSADGKTILSVDAAYKYYNKSSTDGSIEDYEIHSFTLTSVPNFMNYSGIYSFLTMTNAASKVSNLKWSRWRKGSTVEAGSFSKYTIVQVNFK